MLNRRGGSTSEEEMEEDFEVLEDFLRGKRPKRYTNKNPYRSHLERNYGKKVKKSKQPLRILVAVTNEADSKLLCFFLAAEEVSIARNGEMMMKLLESDLKGTREDGLPRTLPSLVFLAWEVLVEGAESLDTDLPPKSGSATFIGSGKKMKKEKVTTLASYLIELRRRCALCCKSFPKILVMTKAGETVEDKLWHLVSEIIWRRFTSPIPRQVVQKVLLHQKKALLQRIQPTRPSLSSMDVVKRSTELPKFKPNPRLASRSEQPESTNQQNPRSTLKFGKGIIEKTAMTFSLNDHTSFPYLILRRKRCVRFKSQKPACSLIVINDLFETYEYYEVFFSQLVAAIGCEVLLFNLPGQAFTVFDETESLSTVFYAFCLHQLLTSIGTVESTGVENFARMSLDRPFQIVGFGNGANVAVCYVLTYYYYFDEAFAMSKAQDEQAIALMKEQTMLCKLAGIVLINPYLRLETSVMNVISNLMHVFQCIPEARNDLPLYTYAKFIFSHAYLKKAKPVYAINLYASVFNPITLKNRLLILAGVKHNPDLFPGLKLVCEKGFEQLPMTIVHSSESAFLTHKLLRETKRNLYPKRTEIISLKSGHEIIQERRKELFELVRSLGLLQKQELKETVNDIELYSEKKDHGSVEAKQLLRTGAEEQAEIRGLDCAEISVSCSSVAKAARLIQAADSKTDSDHPGLLESSFLQPSAIVVSPLQGSPGGGAKPEARSLLQDSKLNDKTIFTERAREVLFNPETRLFGKAWRKRLGKTTRNDYLERLLSNQALTSHTSLMRNYREFITWRVRQNVSALQRIHSNCATIQKCVRAFLANNLTESLKRCKYAILLQRSFRMRLARNKLQMRRKERFAAGLVQRNWRGRKGREIFRQKGLQKRSAILLQARVRGYQQYQVVERLKLRRTMAATQMQRIVRGKLSRQRCFQFRVETEAVVDIQRVFRGRLGRVLYDKESEKYLLSKNQAEGITFARRLLFEYKMKHHKLNSEIVLLKNEKKAYELDIESLAQQSSELKLKTAQLKQDMHELNALEENSAVQLEKTVRLEIRDERLRIDATFDRLQKQTRGCEQGLGKLTSQLASTNKQLLDKEAEAKQLEHNLVVMLQQQKEALQLLEAKEASVNAGSIQQLLPQKTSPNQHKTHATHQNDSISDASKGTKQLTFSAKAPSPYLKSTEAILKFNFLSTSLSYYNSIRLLRTVGQQGYGTGPSPVPFVDANDCAREHSALPGEVSLQRWRIDHVSDFMRHLELGQYVARFQSASVDGNMLCHLTDTDLKQWLDVDDPLHRKKILLNVSQLNAVGVLSQPRSVAFQEGGSLVEEAEHDAQDSSATSSRLDHGRRKNALKQNQVHQQLAKKASEVQHDSKVVLQTLDEAQNRQATLVNYVRHGKLKEMKHSLAQVEDSPFDEKYILERMVDDYGTKYTKEYLSGAWHVNKPDNKGNTLFLLACQTGNQKVAKLLLGKGANVNHQNTQGQTALHYAMAYNFYDLGAFLVESGADDTVTNIYQLSVYDGLYE